MNNIKMALVGLCSHYESGAQRYDALIKSAVEEMSKVGIELVITDGPVYSPSDALAACDKFKAAGVQSIAVMDVTWVCDSLKYIFTKELELPTVFWAVPYTETFSIGCIQNYGSVLKAQGIHYEFVYGLPSESAVVAKVQNVAKAAYIVSRVKSMRLCLMGPRQTWRVGGPQDMTIEEWEFSRNLGPTIIHDELEVVIDAAKKISDAEAEKVLESLKSRTGKSLCSKKTMLWMAKVYTATKAYVKACGLDAVAAECYPNYSGLMNLTSSWIADDGIIVDTEGDIANTVLQFMLNMAAGSGACALGEVGSYDDSDGFLSLAHEGSTAASLAENLDAIQISPSGDNGSFVGLPYRAFEKCTVCDFQGVNGKYQMMIATGQTLPASHEEWVSGGEKLLVKLAVDGVQPSSVIKQMIDAGLHHHIVVKEGDWSDVMKMACSFLGIAVVELK